MTRTVRLHDIANARTGDKGNRLNLVLVCRDPAHYAAVAAQVAVPAVAVAPSLPISVLIRPSWVPSHFSLRAASTPFSEFPTFWHYNELRKPVKIQALTCNDLSPMFFHKSLKTIGKHQKNLHLRIFLFEASRVNER
jgi:hypothetical protein